MNMKDFMNDNYTVLKIMYDNEVTVFDKTEVRLSQLEIAQALGFSKNKVCNIFQNLQEKGYVKFLNRGKYQLSTDAVRIIKTIGKLNEELGGIK